MTELRDNAHLQISSSRVCGCFVFTECALQWLDLEPPGELGFGLYARECIPVSYPATLGHFAARPMDPRQQALETCHGEPAGSHPSVLTPVSLSLSLSLSTGS